MAPRLSELARRWRDLPEPNTCAKFAMCSRHLLAREAIPSMVQAFVKSQKGPDVPAVRTFVDAVVDYREDSNEGRRRRSGSAASSVGVKVCSVAVGELGLVRAI
jgi:hypothetical protein